MRVYAKMYNGLLRIIMYCTVRSHCYDLHSEFGKGWIFGINSQKYLIFSSVFSFFFLTFPAVSCTLLVCQVLMQPVFWQRCLSFVFEPPLFARGPACLSVSPVSGCSAKTVSGKLPGTQKQQRGCRPWPAQQKISCRATQKRRDVREDEVAVWDNFVSDLRPNFFVRTIRWLRKT